LQSLPGVALGLVASVALTGMIKNLLFGVSVADPPTFAANALLLIAVPLRGCLVPARGRRRFDWRITKTQQGE